MSLLALCFFVMTLIASAFIFYPLWYPQKIGDEKQLAINKTWYFEQLKDLQQALHDKKINQADFEKNHLQLQKDFLLFGERQILNEENQPRRFMATLLVVIFFVSAVILYQHFGARKFFEQQAMIKETEGQTAREIEEMGGTQAVINQLKQQARLHPKDPELWYLLGQIYLSQNHFHEADRVFEKAAELAPDRQDIAIAFVEASYLSKDPKTDERLTIALKRMPEDPSLLNLRALIFYHQKKYQQALVIWQNLLQQVPVGSDSTKALQAAIHAAQLHSAGRAITS